MVWAVYTPTGFGKFFPNGDYVGWEEALQDHWDNEISEEEEAEIDIWGHHYVVRKFNRDFGPLHDAELVKEFRTEKSLKELASLAMIDNQLLIIEEALKDLIEELEPEVHQFWPIKISMPQGKVYPKSYFGMRIGQFLDSFCPEDSNPVSFKHMKTYYRSSYDSKSVTGGLAMKRQKIGSAHLWREEYLINPRFFISDVLRTRIADKGLSLPKHHQTKVV